MQEVDLQDDEEDLFRRAVADAKPLAAPRKVPAARKKPAPRARFRRADEQAVLSESLNADRDELEAGSGEVMRFSRPAVGKRTMRKLARGNYAVQAEIDLHGMTVSEAKPRLLDFIDTAARTGKRCVRVVHGKGLGSGPRGAVLKPNVDRWLRRMPAVMAFVSTRQVHGGTGAVYVLLSER
jgi:DNA-nicking Smr family endonuclease